MPGKRETARHSPNAPDTLTHQQPQLYCIIQTALKHQEKPWHFVRVSSNRQNAQPNKSSIIKKKRKEKKYIYMDKLPKR